MRVLVFAQVFGGRTLTFIYNEVIALSKHCEVWVVCNSRDLAEKFPYDKVVTIPFNESWLAKRIKWKLFNSDILFTEKNKAFASAINKAIDEIKPDVIHCHFANESIRLTDNFTRNDIPILINFHGYDATQFDRKKCYTKKIRETFNRPKIYPLFVSDYIKKRAGQMGIDTTRGYKLFLGIDLDRFVRKEFPSQDKGINFLQISSFAAQKGHQVTVPVIKKFLAQNHKTQIKFIFGGAGGTEGDKIKKLVEDYGLTDHIHFTGRLDPSQVIEWMENAHYFLHHSVTGPFGETEGLPTAIMEAMAMELPVLTTWHAGIPELVEDGVNGILINEGDEDAYVEKLNEMMQWGYLPQNRKKVQEMCDIKNHTTKLLEIYRLVIKKSN